MTVHGWNSLLNASRQTMMFDEDRDPEWKPPTSIEGESVQMGKFMRIWIEAAFDRLRATRHAHKRYMESTVYRNIDSMTPDDVRSFEEEVAAKAAGLPAPDPF